MKVFVVQRPANASHAGLWDLGVQCGRTTPKVEKIAFWGMRLGVQLARWNDHLQNVGLKATKTQ